MPIIYTVIARGTTILAEYAVTTGNFQAITASILEKIKGAKDTKMTYVYDNYLFHYIIEDNITFLCLTDSELGRRRPFTFLEALSKKFGEKYQDRAQIAINYGLMDFADEIGQMMEFYSKLENDAFQSVQGQVDQVRDIMVNNIEKVLERGDRIDMLVDRTEQLSQASAAFKKRSTALRRQM